MNETKHDETLGQAIQAQPDTAAKRNDRPEKPKRGPVRRVLRWTAFGMAGLLGLVAVSAGGGLLFLRSDMGERWLTGTLNASLASIPSGLSGSIQAFKGPLLSEAHVEGLVLKDGKGEWLTAQKASLRIDWSALPSAFVISELSVDRPVLLRAPVLEPSAEPAQEESAPPASPEEMLNRLDGFLKDWPEHLPVLRVEEIALRSAEVKEAASPVPLVATATASASAGPEGIAAKLAVLREDGPLPADAPNRRASVEAALEPGLLLSLDAALGDLGLASLFIPPQVAASPAIGLGAKGKGPISDWKLSLDGSLGDIAASGKDAAGIIASLAGSIGLRPLEKAPQAEASLELKTGALAKRLWAMAGQKDGRLSLKLDAKAKAGEDAEADTKLDILLSDMQWGTPLLDALLGREASAGTSASVRLDGKAVKAGIEKLYAHAAHIKADAAGFVALDGKGLYSKASRADIAASVLLNDAATLSPELSGDLEAKAGVSGTFTDLKTELELISSRLDTAAIRLKDTDIRLAIPSADIARILDALAGAAVKSSKPLMEGSVKAALHVNEQPAALSAGWRIREAGKSGLDVALESMDVQVGGNSVTGQMAAKLKDFAAVPPKGTVAALIGTALPALDGRLTLSVPDWKTLSVLSGLSLAGQPLHADITLENKGRQTLALDASLPAFSLDASGTKAELAGTVLGVAASDLWGKPEASLELRLKELKADKAVLIDMALTAGGGLSSLDVALQSKGGLESDVLARWKPGRITLEKLDARLEPLLLGLAKGQAAGLSLSAPVQASYSGTSIDIPSLSMDILPAGRLELEGSFSPSRLKSHFLLTGVDLAKYRPFVPSMPAGLVDMQADFKGTPYAPSGNFKFNLKEILVPGTHLDAFDAELSGSLGMKGKRRMLEAKLDLPEKTLKALRLERFVFAAHVPFTSPQSGVSLPDMKAPFKADAALHGEVGGLWKLVPAADLRLSGQLDLDSQVTGSLSAPVVTAHAALSKGRFFDILNGVGLRAIDLKLDAKKFDIMNKKADDKVTFSLSARAGSKGTLDLGGWLDPATMALDIDGSMKNLAPLRRQDAKVMLSGTLGVKGTVASPQVKADITVDKGQIELAKLPGSSIPELEIWTPAKEEEEREKRAAPGHLDVTVRIPNQFFVRGYGLDCEWSGLIRIDSPISEPAVRGGLKAVRGTLDILGKNFKLAEGRVSFDGGWPVNPLLNINMEYKASELTANVIVSGTSTRPKLTLTSQPAYPQDEIISQIMFGQSSGSLSHVQAIQLASGAAALAGFGGADVMGLGRKILGVDVFKVNSDNDGEESDVSNTSLEVGSYVTDNIYVGMEQGVGKEGGTGAVVEIEVTPSLEVQAKAGSKDSEIGLEWKKNY